MPNGKNGNGGHNHNDKLSFELNIFGQDFIVDGGCPFYTNSPDLRNSFRIILREAFGPLFFCLFIGI